MTLEYLKISYNKFRLVFPVFHCQIHPQPRTKFPRDRSAAGYNEAHRHILPPLSQSELTGTHFINVSQTTDRQTIILFPGILSSSPTECTDSNATHVLQRLVWRGLPSLQAQQQRPWIALGPSRRRRRRAPFRRVPDKESEGKKANKSWNSLRILWRCVCVGWGKEWDNLWILLDGRNVWRKGK